MSGLGKVQEGGATFLSVAGGYIWDRKADQSHPDYATQDYEKADKSTGTRTGARYADLTGKVTKVEFRTHAEYGESINVTFKASEDFYIISISTNNRYSQDMMKALLNMDLEKSIFLKPYDFIGEDKKRAQGISFKQDGAKLDLKVADAPTKDAEWFKKADKKAIKRFFEDLNDWFVAEVEANVILNIKAEVKEESGETEAKSAKKEVTETKKPVAETKKEEKVLLAEPIQGAETLVTPLGMKKVLRAYIAENYPGAELPSLEKDELVKWYSLALEEEELPFPESNESEEDEGVMSEDELNEQLDKLIED